MTDLEECKIAMLRGKGKFKHNYYLPDRGFNAIVVLTKTCQLLELMVEDDQVILFCQDTLCVFKRNDDILFRFNVTNLKQYYITNYKYQNTTINALILEV